MSAFDLIGPKRKRTTSRAKSAPSIPTPNPVPTSDPKIFVSPTEPLALHSLGQTSLIPEEHGVDILDLGSRVGIQRKTVADLYASMNDGRLSKQVQQVQNSPIFSYVVLLLEGNLFTLEVPMTDEQLSMALLTIQRSGYYLVYSKNLMYTVRIVPQIFSHFRRENHDLVNRPPNIQSDWRLTMLQLLPGIGSVKSKRILDRMGFPFEIKDREKLEGIVGKNTYQKIIEHWEG